MENSSGKIDETEFLRREQERNPRPGAKDAWRSRPARKDNRARNRDRSTASRLLAVGRAKPKLARDALRDRRQARNLPARPSPSGRRRPLAAAIRGAPDRGKMLRHAPAKNAKTRIGCACCMCVMPGMGTPMCAFGLIRRAPRSSRATAARVSPTASITNMPKIGGDKFVAAAAGVQLESERAEIFDQRHFDKMMHVFGGRSVEPRGIARGALGNLVERRLACRAFPRR